MENSGGLRPWDDVTQIIVSADGLAATNAMRASFVPTSSQRTAWEL